MCGVGAAHATGGGANFSRERGGRGFFEKGTAGSCISVRAIRVFVQDVFQLGVLMEQQWTIDARREWFDNLCGEGYPDACQALA